MTLPLTPSPVEGEKTAKLKIESSARILREAIDTFNPTHIVSMVSGGKDSAASDHQITGHQP